MAEPEEVEAEVASSDLVDVYPPSTGDGSGRSRSGPHRVWARVSKLVSLPRSSSEDWGAAFTFILSLVCGWQEEVLESDDTEVSRNGPARAAAPSSSRGGAGMGDPIDQNLSCLWG